MIKHFATILACLLITATSSLAAAPLPKDLPTVLHALMPAVVNVAAQGEVTTLPTQGEEQNANTPNANQMPASHQFESLGSGVIIDATKGYIITNAHVINQAKTITISLSDGRKFKAKLIGADIPSDIAVLQIEPVKLTAISLADSDNLRVGDFVAAVGNPYGLNQTVTSGIISGLQRTQLGIEGYENFIQTDASINPGNSGGALINQQGQLIGINTAIFSPDGGNVGIGFAIPINMAHSVMTQLIQYGSVKRGLMGVNVQDLTPDLADGFHLSGQNGAVVSFIIPGSPAEHAGIKAYDIIQGINNKKIKNAADVKNTVGLLRVNATIHLSILRDQKVISINLVTADPKQYQQENIANNPFLYGIALHNFDEITSDQGHIRGVIIIHVKQDSAPWRAGLRPADVIVSANHIPVTNLDQLVEAAKRDKQQLLLNVLRNAGALFVVVK